MPKLEPKEIQKELKQKKFRSVYWLYGSETLKLEELLKRIRKSYLGSEELDPLKEEKLDGTQVTAAQIMEAAQTGSLLSPQKILQVRDAHAVKNSELLSELFSQELSALVIFFAKDFDRRKKISKLMMDKAAVVACESVPETDREAWIDYLAKNKGLTLTPEMNETLRSLDPWNLERMVRELEKLELSSDPEVVYGTGGSQVQAQELVEAIFERKPPQALKSLIAFSQPQEALPLLGLLAWNARQLTLVVLDQERGKKTVRMNPYQASRFRRWARFWSLEELQALQKSLSELDFSFKQTPKNPKGLWSDFVLKNSRRPISATY